MLNYKYFNPFLQRRLAMTAQKFFLALIFSCFFLVAGCAGIPQKAEPRDPFSGIGQEEQIMLQFLLAEMAGEQEDYRTAALLLLALAEKTSDPRLAERALQAALLADDMDSAEKAASLWLSLAPDTRGAREALVALMLEKGKWEAAKPHLQALLAQNWEAAMSGFVPLMLRAPDPVRAYHFASELLLPYEGDPRSQNLLATLAVRAQDYAAAEKHAKRFFSAHPNDEGPALLLANILMQEDPNAAVTHLRAFAKGHPQAKKSRLALAQVYVSQEKWKEALEEYQVLLRQDPKNLDLLFAMTTLAIQAKDYSRARNYLKKGRAAGLDADRLEIAEGRLEAAQGDLEAAKGHFLAVESYPARLEARLILIGALSEKDKDREALALLENFSCGEKEECRRYALLRADVLRRLQRLDEAFALLTRLVEEEPDDPDARYSRAMVAEKMDRIDTLEQDLRHILVQDPNNPQFLNALGYTYANRGIELDKARQLIEKALSLRPQDGYILDSMGWVLYRQGRLDEAESWLRRAYGRFPDPEVAAHLAEVLWKQGKLDEARKILKQALAKYPRHELLQKVVNRLR